MGGFSRETSVLPPTGIGAAALPRRAGSAGLDGPLVLLCSGLSQGATLRLKPCWVCERWMATKHPSFILRDETSSGRCGKRGLKASPKVSLTK